MFKVFDKDNTGEITINQVYELINKFDDAQRIEEAGPSKDATPLIGASNLNTNGLSAHKPSAKITTNSQGKSPTTKKTPLQQPLSGGLQLKPTPLEGSKIWFH